MLRSMIGLAGGGEIKAVEGSTVLVIEDDVHACEALVQVLSLRGHQVTSIATWDHASAVLSGGGPAFDVVVMDLKLGRRKAFDLITELTSRPVPHGPIVVTGSEDAGDKAECLSRGALHVFEKPYETQELLEVVAREALRMRRNRAMAARDRAQRIESPRPLSDERLAWLQQARAVAREWGLTRRELDVLLLSLEGLTSAQCALRLGITGETAQSHIQCLGEKSQQSMEALRARFGQPPIES